MYNIQKTIAECVNVHLHFDCLIREYIYSLGLKLGSTLPPHSFRRAYIYSLEKIIIWSPGHIFLVLRDHEVYMYVVNT